jgi:putative tryptophan/tyrosine transport system substrate-binding protein
MKRREFITLLSGAAVAWPLVARAQQPAMPVIGFLHPSSPEPFRVRTFRQGSKDAGFIEGENVAVEYRWADDQIDRLPTLATELVQRRARRDRGRQYPLHTRRQGGNHDDPHCLLCREDPVRLGHVASLARPGGNLTGINVLSIELAASRGMYSGRSSRS